MQVSYPLSDIDITVDTPTDLTIDYKDRSEVIYMIPVDKLRIERTVSLEYRLSDIVSLLFKFIKFKIGWK